MEKQRQKAVYQVTWANSDGEITSSELHTAYSSEDALRWAPSLGKRDWKRNINLVDDERLRSLLGLLGMHMHGVNDLRVWFNVTISKKVDGEYEAYKGAVIHR